MSEIELIFQKDYEILRREYYSLRFLITTHSAGYVATVHKIYPNSDKNMRVYFCTSEDWPSLLYNGFKFIEEQYGDFIYGN